MVSKIDSKRLAYLDHKKYMLIQNFWFSHFHEPTFYFRQCTKIFNLPTIIFEKNPQKYDTVAKLQKCLELP